MIATHGFFFGVGEQQPQGQPQSRQAGRQGADGWMDGWWWLCGVGDVGDVSYLLDPMEGDPEVRRTTSQPASQARGHTYMAEGLVLLAVQVSRSFWLRFKTRVVLPLLRQHAMAPLGQALHKVR